MQAWIKDSTKYSFEQVATEEYGISFYEKFNEFTGGDSARLDEIDIPKQGWALDYYNTGNLLHKGYYQDGHLNYYKNYYPNGQLERSFEAVGLGSYIMKSYYKDGTQKAIVHYRNGIAQKETDFYPNGQVDFFEEYNKNVDYLINRKSYSENGVLISEFKLTDKKKKTYTLREFFDNGTIKEEGVLAYDEGSLDYKRDGVWKTYDADGKIVSEELFVSGQLTYNSVTLAEQRVKEVDSQQKNAQLVSHTNSKNIQVKLPKKFKYADVDKDGLISQDEISLGIDSYFEGNKHFSPEIINELIDYFFEQG